MVVPRNASSSESPLLLHHLGDYWELLGFRQGLPPPWTHWRRLLKSGESSWRDSRYFLTRSACKEADTVKV